MKHFIITLINIFSINNVSIHYNNLIITLRLIIIDYQI
jgi:hypothetical protein